MHFVKKQGVNNKRPSEDLEQFKYCSSMITEVWYGTIRLLKDESNTGRGNKVIGDATQWGHTFHEYCKLNLCTDKGLDAITKYNCYNVEWEAENFFH